MLHGIDVASYQGPTPDFATCDVVAIKVSEGTGYVNPYLREQIADARTHGSRIIFYHYPNMTEPVTDQINHFTQSIPGTVYENDVYCLDWEWYGQNVTAGTARSFKDAWIATIKQLHPTTKCIIYSDVNNWTTVDQNSNCGDGLWIADYTHPPGNPGIQHPWFGHQYTDKPNDEDVWNFPSVTAYDAWAREYAHNRPPTESITEMNQSFEINNQSGGVTFARGTANNVSFFVDNTLLLGSANLGVDLRVVIWATGDAPHVQTVRVSNTNAAQTTIDFPNPSMTHSVTVTRADSNTITVYGEIS